MDDDGITRADRLRKLAKDESQYGQGSFVDKGRKKFQLEQEAADEEAVASDSSGIHAKGNPMRAIGNMRWIR